MDSGFPGWVGGGQWIARCGAGLFVSSLLLATPALAAEALDGPDLPQVPVTGLVSDVVTGSPIPAVALSLYRSEEDGLFRQALTDPEGRFNLDQVPVGSYRLTVEALGYREVSGEVEILDEGPVEISIEMVPQALELDPVMVTGVAQTALRRAGFYDRRRGSAGIHLTRDEVLARASFAVSDAFRTLPGVRVIPRPGPGRGADVRFRGGCVPELYLNGLPTLSGSSVDDLLVLADVEAIEVYRGATAPAQFSRGGVCGSIVVWTRMGTRSGDPLSWRKVLVAVGFAIGSILLTR